MTKADLISQVASEAQLTKAQAERVINSALDVITSTLSNGESVQFIGFGNFEVKTRAARVGVNPKTKEKIQIAESKAVSFKAGKKLKDAVKGA